MNILVGNIGSTSIKSKLIRFTANNIAELLGEANLDKIKSKETSPTLPRDCIACLNGFFLKEYRFKMYIYRNNFRIQPGNHDNHPWRAGAQFGAS